MSTPAATAIDRARALAAELARALGPLCCRGHVVAVPGRAAPSFAVARRFVEVSLWMHWRAPHVMVVACVLPGDRPAALVATWDPRGVALRQTVTAAENFAREVDRAAEAMAALGDDDRALAASLRRDEVAAPELENEEFWPEVMARVEATAVDEPDDPKVSLCAALIARAWPARLADVRERLRALDD